ncbi:MAG TPA: VOC family protein [Pirellulaceae bacterium]|nr:VOC family protein [Pirellulaceae bacterium]
MQAQAILETCLYVDDLVAAQSFYEQVLGLTLVDAQPDRHLFFRCGRQMLLVFRADASSHSDGVIPAHGAVGPGHVAFAATEQELHAWQQQFVAQQVAIEQDYAWPQGGRSLYFRDPAGNCLEIATPKIWNIVINESER